MVPPADPEPAAHPPALAVIGAGYVGLATAAGFASLGHRVAVGEADSDRLGALQQSRLPIYEPGLGEVVRRESEAGRLAFFADNARAAAGAAAVFLAVPTPEGEGGSVDLSAVGRAIVSLTGAALAPAAPIVVKSSVPPGSWRKIRRMLDEAGMPSPLVVNPEFLQEGRALDGVLNPHRVVVGGEDPAAVDLVAALHEPLGAPIVRTDPTSAELIKYAANAYLATRLTFVNAVANLAEDLGADVGDVLAGLAHDPRIGSHYLTPGPGYGGSCFPKDVRALIAAAAEHDHDLRLFRVVVETNDAQLDRVVAKLRDGLGDLDGAVIGLLGLAFKGGTDDTRSSPAVAIAGRLLDAGARVRAFDPAVRMAPPGVEAVPDAISAVAGADAVLVATEWPEFAALDPARLAAVMRGTLVVDARNLLDREAVAAAGLRYRGVGR